MRFIHCADLHLDSKIQSLPTEKARIRREEVLSSFERLLDYASLNEITAVIIAGDTFDTQKISAKTLSRVLHKIKNTPCDVLYLAGNHDEAFIKSYPDLPENLHFFGDDWTEFKYGNVNIVGANPGAYGILPDTLNLNENDKNIVVMHGQVAGYKTDEKAELISIPKLKNKNIDYLALGHIHYYSEKELDARGKYAYSGCLDARGFDETGEKGFVLITETEKGLNTEFVKFSSRQFVESEYEINPEFSWWEQVSVIEKMLTEKYSSNFLIKLVLKGRYKLDYFKDVDGLVESLNKKFFFAKVYDKTSLDICLEDFEYDKSIKGEFVRLVLKSDLTEEEKNSVILTGFNALKGEV